MSPFEIIVLLSVARPCARSAATALISVGSRRSAAYVVIAERPRIRVVSGVIRTAGVGDLADFVLGVGVVGGVTDFADDGEEDADQDDDDADDDEEFDEGETPRNSKFEIRN